MTLRVSVLFLFLSVSFQGVAAAQGLRVAGSVADAQGAAVVGATVALTPDRGPGLTGRTGSDGAFSFESVAPGSYILVVDSPGFARTRQAVTVAAGMAPVAVTLQVAGLAEDVSVTASLPATLEQPTLTGSRLGITLL